jgi:hypothetical protein
LGLTVSHFCLGARAICTRERWRVGFRIIGELQSGGLPRRIQIHKQLGNLYDDNQLGALAGQAGDEPAQFAKVGSGKGINSFRQKLDIREFSFRIEKIKLEAKDGAFLMTEWNADEIMITGDARAERQVRTENSVRSLDFPLGNREEVFRFQTQIPNKTQVIVMDGAPGAQDEWIDGDVKLRAGN